MSGKIFAIGTMLIAVCSIAGARVINVPADYSTIQGGIDAAVNGDTVLVAPGTYTENPLIENKNIVLQSTGSPDNTIIQGYTIFNGTSIDSTCIFRGFRLSRNVDFSHDLLEIVYASPKIEGNRINGSFQWPGSYYSGVNLSYSNAILRSNIIENNRSYVSGHGIKATNSFPTIEGNVIFGNGGNGGGWDAYGWGVVAGSCIFRYNLVASNGAHSAEGCTGAGISVGGDHLVITNNTIVRNGAQGYYTYGNTGGIEFSVPSNGDLCIIRNNIISLNWFSVGVTGVIQDPNWTGWDYNLVFANDTIDYRGFQSGPHDLQVDPMFVDTSSGDYHLQATSPCIDAGDPSFPLDPDSTRADIGAYFFDQAVDIDDPGPNEPYQFALSQNYPNPFNAQTTITYCLDKEATVSMSIYSITGQLMKIMVDKDIQGAGEHRYIWDGTDGIDKPVSTGIYFYELYVDGYKESKAMIMIK